MCGYSNYLISGLISVQTVRKSYQQTTLVGIELTLLIFVPVKSTLTNSDDPDQMLLDKVALNQDLHSMLKINNLQGHLYMIL